jgi:hypothetical protein
VRCAYDRAICALAYDGAFLIGIHGFAAAAADMRGAGIKEPSSWLCHK